MFDFPYFSQKFYRFYYRLRKKTSKKTKQSATLPKGVYCYRYCFLETKDRMHNEVGTCAEILPAYFLSFKMMYFFPPNFKYFLRKITFFGDG